MLCDRLAYRVQLEYDRVASIKRFDPVDQSGGGKIDRFVIRPLKEVVWDEARLTFLETASYLSAKQPSSKRP
jgi:transcription-repair coupling factor (superfamily II helicase)